MNKSKYFVLVAVMMATMLLIFGNWEETAQANSLGIIDVTPTPTITPDETPEIPLGKIPSAEEQEELKVAIQSYIEIRYRALSISDAEDFKRNGFGNLISSEASKETGFLPEEMGKLAVEVKHAELDHLRYVNYKVFLDFHSITVDPTTQTATILVSEGNEVVYEISAELNPENPIISHTAGIEHTIVLRKEQGKWKIVSDTYNDDLWKMLRQKGKSTEEILHTTDEILRTMKPAPRPALGANNTETAPSYTVPDDPSSHPYDRAGAVQYAWNHWNKTADMYNPNYWDFSPDDCQNFVSQALYEGGNITMFIPYPDNLTPGGPGWYYLDYVDQYTNHVGGGWVDVGLFYTRATDPGEAWSEAFNEGPEGIDITLPQNDQVPAGLMLGDVIQYDWGKDGSWDHAAIVVDFVSGVPYVAAHTVDHDSVPYTLQTDTNYRFIHIKRSNGYPPIKAETMLAADDAGGNPGSACPDTNSDLGNNYLGGCFNGDIKGVTSGFLFRNIQIPPGGQIKYAYVTFTTDGPYTPNPGSPGIYAPISVQIYGENTGTPASFSPTNTPAQRTILTTPVLWTIDGTINGVTYDTWDLRWKRTTPPITSVIQAITGNNWAYGNTISLIFKNGQSGSTYARRVLAYERIHEDSTLLRYLPARLIVAYDLSAPDPLPTITSSTFSSVGAYDGWILESTETSEKGGTYNASSTVFDLGDDVSDKQYRTILHFNTSGLPDNAIITTVELKIKQWGSVIGTNPFTTHGNLIADIKKPYFGNSANLAKSDFEATAGSSGIATFNPAPYDGWYSAALNSTAFPFINLTGNTQFRLAFTLGDDDDLSLDVIYFSSGNDSADQPQLIVYYYVP